MICLCYGLFQLRDIQSDEALRAQIDTLLPQRFECGLRKPTTQLTTSDIPGICQGAILHAVLWNCKAETDQFIEGTLIYRYTVAHKYWPKRKILCLYAHCCSAELYFFSAEYFFAVPSMSQLYRVFSVLCQAFFFHADHLFPLPSIFLLC